MAPAKKQFDFETYVIQQFEEIKNTLGNLNTAYVPREEIMLMHTQTQTIIASLSGTVSTLTTDVNNLKTSAAQSQGAKMSRRELLAWVVAAAGIIGGLWWLPTFIHKG